MSWFNQLSESDIKLILCLAGPVSFGVWAILAKILK